MSGLEGVIYTTINNIKTAIDQLAGQNVLNTVRGTDTVAAVTALSINIIPPAGQKWKILVSASMNMVGNDDSHIQILISDGTASYGSAYIDRENNALGDWTSVSCEVEITNTVYCVVYFNNRAAVGKVYGYQYSGVRLT